MPETTADLLAPVARARVVLGLRYGDVAHALGVDESTLHRWRAGTGRRSAVAGRALEALADLLDALALSCPDAEAARAWLDTPNPRCDGEPPRTLLLAGRTGYLAAMLRGGQDHAREGRDAREARDARGLAPGAPVARPPAGVFPSIADDVVGHTRPVAPPSAGDESLLAQGFTHAPVGLARLALTGELLQVNDRLCEILGRPRAALLGRRFGEVTHPDDLAAGLDRTLQLLAGAGTRYTLRARVVHPDGAVQWVRLSVTLLRGPDGAARHLLRAAEPLSEGEARALAAAEAVEAEERARVH
jgi:PAS domain S-box-containing protein